MGRMKETIEQLSKLKDVGFSAAGYSVHSGGGVYVSQSYRPQLQNQTVRQPPGEVTKLPTAKTGQEA